MSLHKSEQMPHYPGGMVPTWGGTLIILMVAVMLGLVMYAKTKDHPAPPHTLSYTFIVPPQVTQLRIGGTAYNSSWEAHTLDVVPGETITVTVTGGSGYASSTEPANQQRAELYFYAWP